MLATLSAFQEEYGTSEDYLLKCTHLAKEDIDKLKAGLLTEWDNRSED
jgi:hypothetical protein